MSFRTFSIEYSLIIQCPSASRANCHKVFLTSGGGSFSRALVSSSYSSLSALCSGIASSNFSARSFDSRSRCAQHRCKRFVNLAYDFHPSHTIMPLNLRVKTSNRTFIPRLFRITKKASDGVANVQIQCLSPWTRIEVSSMYRIAAPRILLKIASYSDRTASAARRVKIEYRSRTYYIGSARGFRSTKNFIITIYLRTGKLEFNLPT